MRPPPHILLVNPWIHDFAAYDFWAKPYGLLLLAALLRFHGANVHYIDCLDRFHPKAAPANPDARGGRGPYRKTPLPTPSGLTDVRRQYSRYGIDPAWFLDDLKALSPPDLILVTSLMTYWYPGVQEAISAVKQVFPNTPVVLGGIYATLCPDHARAHSGADKVAAGATEKNLLDIVFEFTGWRTTADFTPEDLDTYPYPAFDLQHHLHYIPLLTSRGCPFDCAYCASKTLYNGFDTRSPDSVAREIDYWHTRFGVKNFAFYDDALLVNAEHHAIPLFEKIIALGHPLRFHTPNAVHIRGITAKTAHLMAHAGFKTLRLGLETYRDATRENLDHKTSAAEFHQAVCRLMEAGFSKEQVGAYLLVGLPDQNTAEVEASIQMVRKTGISPIPAHYTPIPHTRLWPKAVESSRYDLAADPIFCNNAIFPCSKKPFSWNELSKLKHLAAD